MNGMHSPQENETNAQDTAIAMLLEATDGSDDLLPAFTKMFELAIETWQDDLSTAMGQKVDARLYKTSIDAAQFFARKVSPEGANALVAVEGWERPIVLGVTRDLAFACIDALFGGDGSEPPFQTARDLTQIELDLVSHVLTLLAEAVQSSLGGILQTQLTTAPATSTLEIETAGLKDCSMIGCIIAIDVANKHYQALACFPKEAVCAIAAQLNEALQRRPRRDPAWADQLSREVRQTPVNIAARVDGGRVSLDTLSRFQVGDLLPLPTIPEGLIDVVCGEVPLLRCRLEGDKGSLQLTVEQFVDGDGQSVQSLLGRTGTGPLNTGR